jgi:diguanylate cyclase (GGDEF)-like protein
LALPPVGLARARWFYWAFAVFVAITCIPAIAFHPTGGAAMQVAGLAGVAVLVAARTAEFRRGRLLSVWNEVPLALALGLAASAAGPLEAGVGLFFTSCFFRAVYASTSRTLVATVGAVVLLAACARAGGEDWRGPVVSQALGILAATLLTRVLVAALTRQNELVIANERLLAAVFDNLDVAVTVGAGADAPALMNPAARELNLSLGLPEGPAVWHDHFEVYADDGRSRLPRERMPEALARSGQRVRDQTVVLRLPDGTRRYFSVNAAQVTDHRSGGRSVVSVQDITGARIVTDTLAHLATHDPLTGLANRSELAGRIGEALSAAEAEAVTGSVLLLDLDGFKRVNDTLGHAFGDQVLQTVADRLRAAVGSHDLVARLGGDEFAVLLTGDTDAVELAGRVCRNLEEPIVLSRASVAISASVGVAALTAGQDADALLAAADLAMYAAKASGPGQVHLFRADLRDALDRRLRLEAELIHALEHDEFELHYQPYVNLETGQVTGSEALVRWRHPTRGLVPPIEFISLIEDNRMVVPLGRWILHTACHVGAGWQPADPARIRTMSVNVSARQLEDADIVADVAAALAESGCHHTP